MVEIRDENLVTSIGKSYNITKNIQNNATWRNNS